MMQWNTPSGMLMYHGPNEDGGGTWFGHEYADIIKQRYPGRVFDRCYEWCSGPGYIGFSIMSAGLCNSLCLSDKFEQVELSISETVRHNELEGKVNLYVGDSLIVLPEHEKFDLVVSNPPHFLESPGGSHVQRIKVDEEWQTHADFYKHIGNHLADDGIILLQENMAGSRPEDFIDMIEANGLSYNGWFESPSYYDPPGHLQIYYMEITARR